ncbi:MAG: outer membrane protein assembly factor BamD [Proteobacteria bacterium]|nr:outer membrane protein assembly factor BamD [Pseudomonadota bacterium]
MNRSVAALVLIIFCAGCGMFSTEEDPTVSWSANRLYNEAKSELTDGNFEKAIKYYEKLEARYPYGRFAQQAQIEVAYAYYRSNEAESAIAACDRFIKLHPNHPNVDYAFYLKGLANFNEDQGLLGHVSDQDMTERDPRAARDSFEAFKELVNRFPDSKYAADSAARMKYLVNALAQYEVHVARYYVKRTAWVAAANRAQYALRNYPSAPATEEALFIMVKSYDQLGMTDLRDDADRIIHQNFPKSIYFTGGPKRDVPWWKLWD